MDWTLLVVLQILFQPSLSVLFIVEAEQTMYQSEFGGKVVMGCKFFPKPSNPHSDLKVIWQWTNNHVYQEVIRIDNNQEHSASQKYQGRVKLLTDELKEGWAKLQVSNLRINDSGNYQCLVQAAEGTDYKTISLSVKAPYKSVTKYIEKTAEEDVVLLTCQSQGYPESNVTWQDKLLQRHSSNTTTKLTPDQLYKITSQIQVNPSEKNNYTCTFTNDGYSATFHIPDEIPVSYGRSEALIVVLSIAVTLIVITVGVFMYRRRKGTSTKYLDDERDRSVRQQMSV
ncbi:programmed cell death 1 ligand 1-like isoform X2 [Melanotaenia boesemani]|nr:programmed cell death 1 ligand 1-like isoform X2 [Melanotaenia boesemani]